MDYIKNKKSIIYLAIIVATLLICAGVVYFVFLSERTTPEKTPGESAVKKVTNRQLEELDALRQEMNPQPLTSEETDSQMENLDALRQKADSQQSSSQESAKKQIEELNELSSQSQ